MPAMTSFHTEKCCYLVNEYEVYPTVCDL